MDSLTQIVLGAAVGEAVLGKKIGNRAMLWGAIAGTIPDLDVFLKYVVDDITSTEMHRGFSHSLVFCIVASPILAWIAHKIHKKREPTYRNWTMLFFWALVTHPLLDMHTTWGTQFFWPFEVRITYNNIFVADPLYTIPFLVFLIIAMCHKRTNPRRRIYNNVGLIVSTSYMAWTFVAKGIGYDAFQESLDQQNIAYVDLGTKPAPLNSFLWNAQVETKNGFRFGNYSLFDDDENVRFSHEFPKNHFMLDSIRDVEQIQQIIRISAGSYTVEKEEDYLIFTDLRFGQFGNNPDTSPFMWKYKIEGDRKKGITVARMEPDMKGMDMGLAFSQLWARMLGDKTTEGKPPKELEDEN